MDKPRRDAFSNLARMLAHNSKKARDQTVKKLRRWITKRENVTELELLKLWKGLFYCYWMSDKRPVQADLAKKIAKLIQPLAPGRAYLLVRATFTTLLREWGGIDALRMDKFMLLAREIIYEIFTYLRSKEWDAATVRKMSEVLNDTVFEVDAKENRGLCLHVCEIFIDEFKHAMGEGQQVPSFEAIMELLAPFWEILRFGTESSFQRVVEEEIFFRIVEEGSRESPGSNAILCLCFGEEKARKLSEVLLKLASDPTTLECNRDRLYSLREKVMEKLNGSVSAANQDMKTVYIPKTFRDIVAAKTSKPKCSRTRKGGKRKQGTPTADNSKAKKHKKTGSGARKKKQKRLDSKRKQEGKRARSS
mmetsp:Transcript_31226/g.76177  ORF Transcript_31226/g.76177 Transcript_31226/m.76177 type:complete len:363 (+) Transcript_31226:198-1286(+)|eukprot:CAMPEP_0114496510 /NCGR_PEP_ID=MMETSP0109-20121206/5810_1 /TAXON_ID=29199 /ORGANISM="Chlorarachnion reptans, Strain CCCM449" /LENGTH=362 /DNA_ID=CAMNT_0001673791 /DNA_START=182 /DNA_END=1270 /DNA_ORIENTATION=-